MRLKCVKRLSRSNANDGHAPNCPLPPCPIQCCIQMLHNYGANDNNNNSSEREKGRGNHTAATRRRDRAAAASAVSVCLSVCVCASVCGTSLCPFVGHFVVTLGHVVVVVVVAGRMNMQYGIIYANFWHINRAGIFGAKLPGDVTDSPLPSTLV